MQPERREGSGKGVLGEISNCRAVLASMLSSTRNSLVESSPSRNSERRTAPELGSILLRPQRLVVLSDGISIGFRTGSCVPSNPPPLKTGDPVYRPCPSTGDATHVAAVHVGVPWRLLCSREMRFEVRYDAAGYIPAKAGGGATTPEGSGDARGVGPISYLLKQQLGSWQVAP